MKRVLAWIIAASLPISAVAQNTLDTAVTVNYGVIKSVQPVDVKSSHAGGALLGGLLGALGGRSAGWAAGGALLGAGAEGAATKGKTANEYSITLLNDSHIQVATEQQDMAVGDCVAVEQSKGHTNIRRVSSTNCHKPQQVQARHEEDANRCLAAKQKLKDTPDADDAAFNAAMKQVTLDCYD